VTIVVHGYFFGTSNSNVKICFIIIIEESLEGQVALGPTPQAEAGNPLPDKEVISWNGKART
jgi:hypothetical protein